jgi:elongation factor Tu
VQPSPALDPTRPHINVAILGHAGHGKTRLASALTARSFVHESRPWAKHTRRIQYVDLPTYMVRTEAVRHSIAHVVEHESPFRHYDSLEAPGQRRFIRAAMMACGVADVVVLVVSAVDGALSQTREHALIARALGVEQIVVFLSRCDLVSDPDQLDLAENDVREVLTEVGFDGDNAAFVRGALGVENERWDATIDDLIATLDRSVSDPARDSDSPAHATVLWRYDGSVFGVRVALVHVRQGVIRKGDRLLAMFRGQRQQVRVEELRVFDRPVDAAGPGDIVSISLGGIADRNAFRELVRRGTVLTTRTAARLTRSVVASLRLLTRDEGGRHTAIASGHAGLFCFGATTVQGRILLPPGIDATAPGATIEGASVEFQYGVPVGEGARFVVRDGADGLQRKLGGAPRWAGTSATGSITRVRQLDDDPAV